MIYCDDGILPLADNSGCAATATVAGATGRLTSVVSSAAITNYTGFDRLGRVTSSEQLVGNRSYSFFYGYLLGGALSCEKLPSGAALAYDYNNGGLVSAVTRAQTSDNCATVTNRSTSYATALDYAPQGALKSGTFGPLTQSGPTTRACNSPTSPPPRPGHRNGRSTTTTEPPRTTATFWVRRWTPRERAA